MEEIKQVTEIVEPPIINLMCLYLEHLDKLDIKERKVITKILEQLSTPYYTVDKDVKL